MGTNIPKQPSVPKMPSYNSVKSELDLISREATLEAFADYVAHGMSMNDYDALEDIVIHMPSISTEKTDSYKQGWHDAISMALKETHNVYTDDGVFRVVQEETLIGVGMAYEQVGTEKTGHWYLYEMFANGEAILECSVCHNKHNKPWNYCPSCGAKMEEEANEHS